MKIVSLFVFLIFSFLLYAEGSKDLYPSGASGNRAYMQSLNKTKRIYAYPFIDRGAHYVYVNKNEWISLASSTQYVVQTNSSMIKLYDPDGNPISLSGNWTDKTGNILNRAAELAGPALPGSTPSGNQYKAFYYQAQVSGIYRVEFWSNSMNKEDLKRPGENTANGNWQQSDASSLISAWDISVANSAQTSWINGRVFTYNLDMSIVGGGSGFRSIVYVLTGDGFVYRIKNNGTIGYQFEFTVNNRGFHAPNDPNTQLYKSIPDIKNLGLAGIQARYHDPTTGDTPLTTTHKIFYNKPDWGMPEKAKGGQVAGDSTWMRPLAQSLDISNAYFVGAEGTPGQMGGEKGGYIHFTSGTKGPFTMKLSPSLSGTPFTPRVLTGMAQVGANVIYFDGKDGNGVVLPATIAAGVGLDVEISLHFGEVHFPFFDLEYNANGFIIERYNSTMTAIESDKVFWNDVDITRSGPPSPKTTDVVVGQSSNSNGHKWSGTFGDESGLDTWSYLRSTNNPIFDIKNVESDLQITSVTPNVASAQMGDEVSYQILVNNAGPSDAGESFFRFEIPPCFSPSGIATPSFNGNGCGTLIQPITYHPATNEYTASVNMPSGCTVAFHLPIEVGDCGTNTAPEVTASILRNKDVFDQDATNASTDPSFTLPTDIYNECSGVCNNIFHLNELYYSPLPITLTSFNAKCLDDGVQLNWITASETNVDYFELQQSRDGILWNSVKLVDAVGNSSVQNSYSITDVEGFETLYYRLLVVDFDGSTQMIPAISVICNNNLKDEWSLYPIPANESIMIDISSKESMTSSIKILDVSGKVVDQQIIHLENGQNIIPIDIREYSNGIYFLRMEGTQTNFPALRMIKTN